MYKAIIKNIKKDAYQSTQEAFLEVEVEILDAEDVVLETKKLAYAFDTSEEVIKADLTNILKVFAQDKELAEKAKEADDLAAKADETSEALVGAEINLEG